MTPEQLSLTISRAVRDLIQAGLVALTLPEDFAARVERPKIKEHGDYATNVALQLAKTAKMNPREFAQLLVDELSKNESITAAQIAGPGFVNLRVAADAQGEIAAAILSAGAEFGRGAPDRPETINVEFISANPTGPLHLGHTRWAAVGDALARVLAAAGHQVSREFYINDRGAQMDKFGASLMARANGTEPPADGYLGDYVNVLADEIVADDPSILELPEPEQETAFREAGYRLQLTEHQVELAEFNTHFDTWFSERSLHESSAVDHALAKLQEQGHLFESDGATWMRTTDFGDDKDRVLIRNNGELTYFASDAAYYVDKRERGFDRCIYLLGADHHGYQGRIVAMVACTGDRPSEHLEILIGQLVKILQNGEELKLSKRAGTIVSLRELIDLVGVDALRYTLIRFPADTPLTLDVSEMIRASSDNPVYYVQYAHARLSSIVRNAEAIGLAVDVARFDASVLEHEREGELLRALAEFPQVIERSATLREPHRIARYLEDTAATFHKFYDACRVLPQGDEPVSSVHQARLVLVAATRQVFANGLDLLGVSAPDRM